MAHWIDTIRQPHSGGAGSLHRRNSNSRFGGGTFTNLLTAVAETVLEWQKRGAERRRLMELDERMLKDIGVTRVQAQEEFQKPFWTL